jgi:hypothetical protein
MNFSSPLNRACVLLRSKAKNLIRCPSLSREAGGGSGPLRDGDEAKRFYSSVQDEVGRVALYSLEEEARRYVYGEAPMKH